MINIKDDSGSRRIINVPADEITSIVMMLLAAGSEALSRSGVQEKFHSISIRGLATFTIPGSDRAFLKVNFDSAAPALFLDVSPPTLLDFARRILATQDETRPGAGTTLQ